MENEMHHCLLCELEKFFRSGGPDAKNIAKALQSNNGLKKYDPYVYACIVVLLIKQKMNICCMYHFLL